MLIERHKLKAEGGAAVQEERHPSAMGIGSSKEGFSVYGTLNRCVGAPGKRLLRTWLLRPLVDLQVHPLRKTAPARPPNPFLVLSLHPCEALHGIDCIRSRNCPLGIIWKVQ